MKFKEFLDEKKSICPSCGQSTYKVTKVPEGTVGECSNCLHVNHIQKFAQDDGDYTNRFKGTKKKTNDGMFIKRTKKKPAMYSPSWLKKRGYE